MAVLKSYFGLNNNLLSASYFMVLKRIGSSTFTKEAERRNSHGNKWQAWQENLVAK